MVSRHMFRKVVVGGSVVVAVTNIKYYVSPSYIERESCWESV